MTITIDYYPEKPGNPYRLGRHREFDTRHFASSFTLSTPQYKTTVWPFEAPILNQGKIGSCTGDTMADILNTVFFTAVRKLKNNNQYYDQSDAYTFYSQATYISGVGGGQHWPPNDVGATGPAVAQAAENDGDITGYQHCFTWQQFQAAIETQPVMLGTIWTDNMFNPDGNGVCSVGPLNDKTIAGGHEYMARAIFYDQSLILCTNHWTDTWNPQQIGQKRPGEFYLTFADAQVLLNNGGDVTVPQGVGV